MGMVWTGGGGEGGGYEWVPDEPTPSVDPTQQIRDQLAQLSQGGDQGALNQFLTSGQYTPEQLASASGYSLADVQNAIANAQAAMGGTQSFATDPYQMSYGQADASTAAPATSQGYYNPSGDFISTAPTMSDFSQAMTGGYQTPYGKAAQVTDQGIGALLSSGQTTQPSPAGLTPRPEVPPPPQPDSLALALSNLKQYGYRDPSSFSDKEIEDWTKWYASQKPESSFPGTEVSYTRNAEALKNMSAEQIDAMARDALQRSTLQMAYGLSPADVAPWLNPNWRTAQAQKEAQIAANDAANKAWLAAHPNSSVLGGTDPSAVRTPAGLTPRPEVPPPPQATTADYGGFTADDVKNFLDWQATQVNPVTMQNIGQTLAAQGIDRYSPEQIKFAVEQLQRAKGNETVELLNKGYGPQGFIASSSDPKTGAIIMSRPEGTTDVFFPDGTKQTVRGFDASSVLQAYKGPTTGDYGVTATNLGPWSDPNWRTVEALKRAAQEKERVQTANTPSPFTAGPGPAATPQNLTLDPIYAQLIGSADPKAVLRAINAGTLKPGALPADIAEKLFPSVGEFPAQTSSVTDQIKKDLSTLGDQFALDKYLATTKYTPEQLAAASGYKTKDIIDAQNKAIQSYQTWYQNELLTKQGSTIDSSTNAGKAQLQQVKTDFEKLKNNPSALYDYAYKNGLGVGDLANATGYKPSIIGRYLQTETSTVGSGAPFDKYYKQALDFEKQGLLGKTVAGPSGPAQIPARMMDKNDPYLSKAPGMVWGVDPGDPTKTERWYSVIPSSKQIGKDWTEEKPNWNASAKRWEWSDGTIADKPGSSYGVGILTPEQAKTYNFAKSASAPSGIAGLASAATTPAASQPRSEVPPPPQEPKQTTSGVQVADYQGNKFDTGQTLNLAKQVAQAFDLKSSSGGAFSTKNQGIGFEYDQAKQILGKDPSAAEQVMLDVSRYLQKSGVTDLNQIGVRTITSEEYQGIDQPPTISERKEFYNKDTGERINGSGTGYIGNTYTGKGQTSYFLTEKPDGSIGVKTEGGDTSDAGMAAMLLPLVLGPAGLNLSGMLGGALQSAGLGQLASQMVSQGLISGGTNALFGGDFLKGAVSGALGPAISAGIGATIPEGFKAENPALTNFLAKTGAQTVGGLLTGQDPGKALGGAAVSGLMGAALDKAGIPSNLAPLLASLVRSGKITPQAAMQLMTQVGKKG